MTRTTNPPCEIGNGEEPDEICLSQRDVNYRGEEARIFLSPRQARNLINRLCDRLNLERPRPK